jgi:Fic family protein
LVEEEMNKFLRWFNSTNDLDPVIKAAIAHLWFVTIHPFADGNGRMARTITDMQLARTDQNSRRFYSMSAQIRNERKAYYDILEKTQKGTLDITEWLEWFLTCLDSSISATEEILAKVMRKSKLWENLKAYSLNDRQQKMLNALIDGFEGKLTSSKWAKITKTSQDTASRDIQDLIDKGILLKEAAGGRSTSYTLNTQYLK